MTDLAEFCEQVIVTLFEIAPTSQTPPAGPAFGREGIDTPPYTPPIQGHASSSSTPARKEPPILVEFIVSVCSSCSRTPLPSSSHRMMRVLRVLAPCVCILPVPDCCTRGICLSPLSAEIPDSEFPPRIMGPGADDRTFHVFPTGTTFTHRSNPLPHQSQNTWPRSPKQAYALYRTRLPISIVHQSLLLLSRLKQRYPSARGTSSSPHRLFLSSLMLSAKISMDDTYSNKSWAIVGSNYFALREVNQMERELFAFLGWNVVVSMEELDEFVAGAEATIQQAKAARSAECSKRRRIEEEAARHQQAKNAARALLRPHTYRHPSPIRSAPSSGFASPAYQVPHHASPDYYRLHRSESSSAASSNFPSATHSPSSPASAPLSAGPQTPDTEHLPMHPHVGEYHHDSLDFGDAAGYMSKSRKREARSTSRDRFTSHVISA